MPKQTAAQRRAETAATFPREEGGGARMHSGYDLAREYARALRTVGVYISYRPQANGRAYHPAAWQIIRPGFSTDPDGHWRDDGHKTFTVYAPATAEKQAKLEEAKAWVGEKYGYREWERTNRIEYATGDWFPAPVIAWLEHAIADWKKTGETR